MLLLVDNSPREIVLRVTIGAKVSCPTSGYKFVDNFDNAEIIIVLTHCVFHFRIYSIAYLAYWLVLFFLIGSMLLID